MLLRVGEHLSRERIYFSAQPNYNLGGQMGGMGRWGWLFSTGSPQMMGGQMGQMGGMGSPRMMGGMG